MWPELLEHGDRLSGYVKHATYHKQFLYIMVKAKVEPSSKLCQILTVPDLIK